MRTVQPPTTRFAELLAALAQESRLNIVQLAARGGPDGIAAGDLARALHCPPSTLSFHLKELTRCGLLRATPQGRYIRYSVRPATLSALAAFVAALPGPAMRDAPGASDRSPRRGRRQAAAKGRTGSDEQLSMFGE